MNKEKYYAFFDVDGTILKSVSMIEFLKFYFQKKYKMFGKIKYYNYVINAFFVKKLFSRSMLNKFYYRHYKNEKRDYLFSIAQKWFDQSIKNNEQAFLSRVVSILKWHQKNGGEIVFVSGSFYACLEPLAKMLSVYFILCTEMISQGNFYTGKIKYPMIGEAKASAILNFLKEKNTDAKNCYAYGDHISDVFMLECVGNPHVIEGDAALMRWAKLKKAVVLF